MVSVKQQQGELLSHSDARDAGHVQGSSEWGFLGSSAKCRQLLSLVGTKIRAADSLRVRVGSRQPPATPVFTGGRRGFASSLEAWWRVQLGRPWGDSRSEQRAEKGRASVGTAGQERRGHMQMASRVGVTVHGGQGMRGIKAGWEASSYLGAWLERAQEGLLPGECRDHPAKGPPFKEDTVWWRW